MTVSNIDPQGQRVGIRLWYHDQESQEPHPMLGTYTYCLDCWLLFTPNIVPLSFEAYGGRGVVRLYPGSAFILAADAYRSQVCCDRCKKRLETMEPPESEA